MPTSINEPQTPAFEEVTGAVTPTITGLKPNTCAIGDPDFQLHVTGENFTGASIICFASRDEPTKLNDDGTVSTDVRPSLWEPAGTVQVFVRNGVLCSNPVKFTFTDPAVPGTTPAS